MVPPRSVVRPALGEGNAPLSWPQPDPLQSCRSVQIWAGGGAMEHLLLTQGHTSATAARQCMYFAIIILKPILPNMVMTM